MAYHPPKYYAGLSAAEKKKRRAEIERRAKMDWDDPRAYVPWDTNEGIETKPSTYNESFAARYGNPAEANWKKVVRAKAKQAGIPYDILDKVMRRGMAAWRTGHRPGASQVAWGMARVNSFAVGGKTYWTADQDLAREWKQRTGEYFDRALRRRRTPNPEQELNMLASVLDGVDGDCMLGQQLESVILVMIARLTPSKR